VRKQALLGAQRFILGARHRCTCEQNTWNCEDIQDFCGYTGIDRARSCAGFEGNGCTYLVPAVGPNGTAKHIECQCTSRGEWECADGCPADFPGSGASCDPERVVNCTWNTGQGTVFCGCDGEWNCTPPSALRGS
jgi:hypothetical protein